MMKCTSSYQLLAIYIVDGELQWVCPVMPSTALGYDLEVMGTNSEVSQHQRTLTCRHSTLKFSCNSTYYQYHYREVSSSLHYSTGQIKKSMQKGSLDQSLKSFKN